MRFTSIIISLLLIFPVLSIAKNADPYLWLEDIESDQSMGWVHQQNQITLNAHAKNNKEFQKNYNDILKIYESNAKITYPRILGEHVYNFWQDGQHVKGIWRRQSANDFERNKKKWEVVLDVDALAKQENTNWVFKGVTCLKPEERFCLVSLSNGGKDAIELREFDLKEKKFVDKKTEKGFVIPEAKSKVEWKDQNTIYLATQYGANTETTSGYPRMIKVLKRGQDLKDAAPLLATAKTNMMVSVYRLIHGEDHLDVAIEYLDFYNSNYFLISDDAKKTIKLQVPTSIRLYGYFKGYMLFYFLNKGKIEKTDIKNGSLVAMKIDSGGKLISWQKLFTPETMAQNFSKTSFKSLATTKDHLILSYSDDLDDRLQLVKLIQPSKNSKESSNENGEKADKPSAGLKQETFAVTELKTEPLPQSASLSLLSGFEKNNKFYFTAENIDLPTSLYVQDLDSKKLKRLQTLPRFYKSKNIRIQKEFAVSKDGVRIPYFIVSDGKIKLDQNNKVLISGYGGFNLPRKLSYSPVIGKYWLNKKNIYVLANIRGGGEYGPGWHQAATLRNKQKSYDDFIAITEALVAKKIAKPSGIAIMGGSNGGLLVGAVSMQRPDLFGAVVSMVPLLDMKRYHKLLAGASWMSEYGNPEDSQDWKEMQKYSPYHNLDKNKTYPEFLFYTSTKDDRVHPGHARKMVAKMKGLDISDVYLYENTEGGHSGSADLKERAHMWSLIFEFLKKGLK